MDIRVNTENRQEKSVIVVCNQLVSRVRYSYLIRYIEDLGLEYDIINQQSGFKTVQVYGPNRILELDIRELHVVGALH